MKLEEGLDTFVVIDGLPVVPEESRQKLVKFLLRKLTTVGKTSEDAVFMPLNDKGMSEGCVIMISLEYETVFWMNRQLIPSSQQIRLCRV